MEHEGRQVNKVEPELGFQGEAGITGEQVKAVELIAEPRQKRGSVHERSESTRYNNGMI